MGEPVVRRPSSETGTRNGVKQKTEADPSSIMAENSYLISKMPERETGLPNTYSVTAVHSVTAVRVTAVRRVWTIHSHHRLKPWPRKP